MKAILKHALILSIGFAVGAGLVLWLSDSKRKEVDSVARYQSEAPGPGRSVAAVVQEAGVMSDPLDGTDVAGPQPNSGSGSRSLRAIVQVDVAPKVEAVTVGDSRTMAVTYNALTVVTPPVNPNRDAAPTVRIRMKGSDTMIQLGTAWAEAYRSVRPDVLVELSGGGSGVGLAALQNGGTDIANASREIKKTEADKIKADTGKDVKEFAVAYDALAVYTNPKNPIKEISIEELKEIWAEGGTIETWDQVDPGMKGRIVRVGHQNNSGAYDYFRERVCGKTADKKQREFRGGVSELLSSAEVIENVIKTRNAIGYSGLGYKTDKVNWLKVSNKRGEPGVAPGAAAVRSGAYPIARKLYLYTVGEPSAEVKAYIGWILSPAGQKIVEQEGFVSLPRSDEETESTSRPNGARAYEAAFFNQR